LAGRSLKTSDKSLIGACILVSLLFVAIGAVWLSYSAETLDEVAERFGAVESRIWNPPLPNYEIPNLQGNVLAGIAVGFVFVMVILGVTFAVGKLLAHANRM
jgi:hypothetical protein